eukprot:1136861-Pelagomonas_calceolata.AAC.2
MGKAGKCRWNANVDRIWDMEGVNCIMPYHGYSVYTYNEDNMDLANPKGAVECEGHWVHK